MPSPLCVPSFTGTCSQLSTWIIKWLFYWTMKKHEYMQNNKKLKYLSYLVNEISVPEPQHTSSAHQGCMWSPSSLHRIANCHLWSVPMFAFNKVHVGEHLLTYICWSKDRQDSKCIIFHIPINVGDSIPSFEHKVVRFGEAFNITPFVILSKNGLLTGNIFKVCYQAFKLGHPYVSVGQFHLKIRLTHTCKCSRVQQGWIEAQGSDGEG